MVVNYKKLWKILIDRNMRKEDLRVAAGITTTAMAKLGRNETVHMDILLKICKVLDCKIEDIVEITNDVV
ncbi:MAG: helix-turn-helix transcriptional regulator [Eubacteriales bacterium]|nr:helix-turn-helix transcriptional regulator [Christensenellaceae bacterium]MDY2751610.1 helix-turn-helix transcriptional regulator [Eubacteriales bacterium]